MIGFVPPEYYIPRNPKPGDIIICSGWIGAEGTGILVARGKEYFRKKFSQEELEEGTEIGKNIAISRRLLAVNRKYHEALHLVHDATEGGIYGALYECFAPFNNNIIDIKKCPHSLKFWLIPPIPISSNFF